MDDDEPQQTASLLPYDEWTEEALRQVAVRALAHAAREGLPGGHHFYVTFRTDQPGIELPPRLRAQYPQEMTIVLQHQFWGLAVDEAAARFSVGLTFSGVATTLAVPFAAITGFADPEVRFGLRFRVAGTPGTEAGADVAADEAAGAGEVADQGASEAGGEAGGESGTPAEAPQVVSLDAFRRRSPSKE